MATSKYLHNQLFWDDQEQMEGKMNRGRWFLAAVFMGCLLSLATEINAANIIPHPVVMEKQDGIFFVNQHTALHADLSNSSTRRLAYSLAGVMQDASGFIVPVLPASDDGERQKNAIHLRLVEGNAFDSDEAYQLSVNPDRIELLARHPAGLFYGIQTLRQMVPYRLTDSVDGRVFGLASVLIKDTPRFEYRGYMLDVSRNFIPLRELKRYVDLLGLYKLNRFHLHLSDDQGWRVEVNAYPELTEIGAWQNRDDGYRYGGYYTQDEIRDLVAYAAERYVMIIPEFDIPGHTTALRAALPFLNCDQQPREVFERQIRQPREALCIGRESTYETMETILKEMIDLFPAPWFHIGADEAFRDTWKECRHCQQKMRDQGLESEDELQGYFVQRMAEFINQHGKTMVGWDEIIDDEPEGDVVVHSWQTHRTEYDLSSPTARAVKKGYPTIVSPMHRWYLNLPICGGPHSPMGKIAPPHWSRWPSNLEEAYLFEPVPDGLPADLEHLILGGEAPLWSSYTPTRAWLDQQTFPRLIAVAERLWSDRDRRNFNCFYSRLDVHLGLLKQLGVQYGPGFGATHPDVIEE